MTGPAVLDRPKKEPPHPFSPDAFDAAQPSGVTRGLSPEEFDQAQSMTPVQLKSWKLPGIPPAAPKDATSTARDNTKGVPLKPFDIKDPTTYANPIFREVVAPALDNPLTTIGMLGAPVIAAGISPLAGLAVGGAMVAPMIKNIAEYSGQKAAEMTLSPEDRARAEADPERISGEKAAVQALMLAAAPFAHSSIKALSTDVSAGMMEAGAKGLSEFTPAKAEVLGAAAGTHGLPPTANPFRPDTPPAKAWNEGHASVPPTLRRRMANLVDPSVETERRAMAQAASTDELTGLSNRASLDRALPAAEADPNTRVVAVDANNFGKVNKLESHAKGDAFIKHIAQSLSQAAEESGVSARRVFRRGGDEFVVLAPAEKAAAIVARAEEIFGEHTVGQGDKAVKVSITGTHGNTFAEADAGLQAAKTARKAGTVTEPVVPPSEAGPGTAEPVTTPAEGARLAPIEGAGAEATRGVSRSIETRAVAEKLTNTLGELPKYRKANFAEHADKAIELLANNPELARKVALGDAPAPEGMIPEMVAIAVENRAIHEGDVATLRDLATSKLAEEGTTMGQRIAAYATRDPESPVEAIQSVIDVRMRATKNVPKARAEVVKAIRESIAAGTKKPTRIKDWTTFVETLKC